MSDVRLTHDGEPTTLIEVEVRATLTDPTFDPRAGNVPRLGDVVALGRRTGDPHSDLPRIDAVLLTYDHHSDNLDVAGRERLDRVGL
jgi:L-ascorbate metabolism protein UlaG (beta-lactamase superfamily)